jgi:hypothetical protein
MGLAVLKRLLMASFAELSSARFSAENMCARDPWEAGSSQSGEGARLRHNLEHRFKVVMHDLFVHTGGLVLLRIPGPVPAVGGRLGRGTLVDGPGEQPPGDHGQGSR